jgi:hypothetical protein
MCSYYVQYVTSLLPMLGDASRQPSLPTAPMIRPSLAHPIALLSVALSLALASVPSFAQQQPRALTSADYDRAAKMLAFNVAPLVTGGTVQASWLPDDRFYYQSITASGPQWMLVDPAKRTRTALFDPAAMAATLGAAAGTPMDVRALGLRRVEVATDAQHVTIDVGNRSGDGHARRRASHPRSRQRRHLA